MTDWDLIRMMSLDEAIEDYKYHIAENIDTQEKVKVGYKNDKIFLLSIEECIMYYNTIPHCNTDWWTRSYGSNTYGSGYDSYYVGCVRHDGYIDNAGCDIASTNMGVRPVICVDDYDVAVGDIIVYNNFPFIAISSNLAIAKVPITFDIFDDVYNGYENSYLRRWLLDWYEEGEWESRKGYNYVINKSRNVK